MLTRIEKMRELLHHALINGDEEEILIMSRLLDQEIVRYTNSRLKKKCPIKTKIITYKKEVS